MQNIKPLYTTRKRDVLLISRYRLDITCLHMISISHVVVAHFITIVSKFIQKCHHHKYFLICTFIQDGSTVIMLPFSVQSSHNG